MRYKKWTLQANYTTGGYYFLRNGDPKFTKKVGINKFTAKIL